MSDLLLSDLRKFTASPLFQERANKHDIHEYEEGKDFKSYWAKEASGLSWFKKWDTVLESQGNEHEWFKGGRINACYNCLDRHIEGPRRHKPAIVWEGEKGDVRIYTYFELYREVCKFANVLKANGIKKGDRVALYMPMIPEALISMLSCARLGAIHTVVFGGFSADSLEGRINDCHAKLLITADGGFRRGNYVPLKNTADKALEMTPSIQKVIVVERAGLEINMLSRRDEWYHELMKNASSDCPCESMDSTDPLFILYTSGTTGNPKGIVHSTGGYLTHVSSTMRSVFDIKDEDLYWCTADLGWITGHSYVLYGPLSQGASQVVYEGAPDWPERNRFWKIIQKHGVSIFYTAPTAIRSFMKWGEGYLNEWDLSSLRLLGSVGEPINPEAWIWYHTHIGKGKCPIVDTWWQTETGGIVIAPLPGLIATKPGSATLPLPGFKAEILNDKGELSDSGYLVLSQPWPGMLKGIWGDQKRYQDVYWSRFPGKYFTGDGAKRDNDQYFWLLGRVDDVINVSGHRLGTMEIESALVDHPSVAEAAVVAVSDEIRGQSIKAFVILKEGMSETLSHEELLKDHVVKKIGVIARPQKIFFTHELPKTRSGKIMRRLLRDIAEGRVLGDTSTLADKQVIEELKKKYEEV